MGPDRFEHATRRRISIRLLPFVFLLYVISYVDRVNVSFANLRMSADLRFSDRIFGLGAGIFFVGYILFEIPGAVHCRTLDCTQMDGPHHDQLGHSDRRDGLRAYSSSVLCRAVSSRSGRGRVWRRKCRGTVPPSVITFETMRDCRTIRRDHRREEWAIVANSAQAGRYEAANSG